MGELIEASRIFLWTVHPERRQRRYVGAILIASVVLFLVLAPFAKVQLPRVWAFIPIYQSAIGISDLITAMLLIGQYHILRSKAVLVLAGGYLFTSLMAAVHMLTFPGLFTATGLLGAGEQTTAWLYMFWHGTFPFAVAAYAMLKRGDRTRSVKTGASATPIVLCIATVILATVVFTVIATAGHSVLPPIMRGHHFTPLMIVVVTTVWTLSLLALAILWSRKPHSVLDLWVMTVMCAWIFDIALSAVLNQGRFDLGFYAGRAYGLLASSIVLFALMFENGRLYAQVVTALEAEQRQHRRVQDKTLELNEANERLEQRVAERTSELTASNLELRREVQERERAEHALQMSKEELREMASMSSAAREQEKRRIARELHDELAQTLATLKMDLTWLVERVPASNNTLGPRIATMQSLLDEAVLSVRRIASDLRPLILDDLGFIPATEWLVQNFQHRYGIECTLVIDPPQWELPDRYATAVYRLIQESLANVARHARAPHADISLRRKGGQIVLIVRDNGIGFDLAAPRKLTSFGLVGLRERVYLVGGSLSIDTAPGRGTAVEVHIPLPADNDRLAARADFAGEIAERTEEAGSQSV